MADEEQFSLCWNNFNSNLSAGFHESLCRGDLVDVTLAAEGHLVKAHRLVLSVCSPYFRKMFTQMPANQHAFVFLKDVSHAALKDLIQFMYCGEVNVKQDALPTFISTAEALQIKGLTETGEAAATPASQSPHKISIPTPSTTNTINTTSPRSRVQRNISRTSYKLDSEDSSDDKPMPVMAQKRVLQRSVTPISIPTIKRQKNNDPLEENEPTQIIAASDTKSTGEPEFIDLPIEGLPTKSEPEYAEDAGEVEAVDQETTYVEDDSYGDMKYDESYFTENDESKAGASGFTENYAEGGEQSANEAQDRRYSGFTKRICFAEPFKNMLTKKPEDPLSQIMELKSMLSLIINTTTNSNYLLVKLMDNNRHSHAEKYDGSLHDKFPIASIEDLCSLQASISNETIRNQVISFLIAIKPTAPGNIKSSIRQLFKDKVLQAVNWSGTQNKECLEAYSFVSSTIPEVWCDLTFPKSEFVRLLKIEIQLAKQRGYQAKSRKTNVLIEK